MTTVKTLEKRFVDAVRAEDLNAVKEFMELADINPDVVRGSLKLLRNNVVLAAYLVGKGADIKIPDLLKDTMLTCTLQLMAYFVEKGCLKTMSEHGSCKHLIELLLHDGDHPRKLELLLINDAPFSVQHGDGSGEIWFYNTPLYIALKWRRKESFKLMYHYKHSILCDIGLLVLGYVHAEGLSNRHMDALALCHLEGTLSECAYVMLMKGVTYHPNVLLHLSWHNEICPLGSLRSQKACDDFRHDVEKKAAEKLAEEKRIADFEGKISASRVAKEEVARHAAAKEKLEKDKAEQARLAQKALQEKLRQQERLQEEMRVRIAEEIRLKMEYERRDAIAQVAREQEERRKLDDIERRRQQDLSERLRLAEIEEAQRLAAERDRLAVEQERLRLAKIEEAQRLAAEQEAERQCILAEEAKQKTDLGLQITLGTRESIKVALDLIRGKTPLNVTDDENRTPLHLAAKMGHRAIVRALLERQVNREIRDLDDNRAEDLCKDDATRQVFLEVPSNQKIYREFKTAHNIRDAAREAHDPRAKAHLDKAYHREQKAAGRRVFSQVNNKLLHETHDLHAMETEPAKSIVNDLIKDQRRMANKYGRTRVVTLILGRGNHSTDGNPSINPAIRGMLIKRNIDFHDQGMNDGAIEVRFTPLTTDDTSSVSDSVSTSN